jgi:hypothetical protein
MALIQQLCISLKGREIDVWNRLKDTYPSYTKHDVVFFAISALLNKNLLKRTQTWKELRRFYPEKGDWPFIDKILKERLDERYNHSINKS